jgi:multiple sugar transport system substrate-binding protein
MMSNKRLSRREFLAMSAGLAVGSWLTACGAAPPAAEQPAEAPAEGEAAAPAEEEAPEAAPAAEAIEVSFSGWGGTEEDEGVRAAMKVFEEENPNIKMSWIHIPDAGAYNDKVLALIAAGTPPDTGFIQGDIFTTFARDKLLLDITESLKADATIGKEGYFIEPQETQRCSYEGSWYGIGSCWVAPHIYYNADIFEQEGIDPPSNNPEEAWDWNQLVENSIQLTVDTAGKHPGESGFDPDNIERWGIHWPTWWIPVHSAIASNGGNWIDRDTGMLALDKPEAIEAIQNIADLVLKHQVMPEGAAIEQLGMSNTQMLENGKLAMAVDGSWALAWIHKINAGLGTAVLPKMKEPATNMQAHLHSVFASTQNPEEAWQWVSFLATEYYQLQFLKIGLWLPSQTALMTPEGRQEWMTLRTSPTDGVHPEGYEQIVTEFVPKYGHVTYMPPGWAKVAAIITPAMDAVWVGDQTAEEAMTSAIPEANAILETEQQKG